MSDRDAVHRRGRPTRHRLEPGDLRRVQLVQEPAQDPRGGPGSPRLPVFGISIIGPSAHWDIFVGSSRSGHRLVEGKIAVVDPTLARTIWHGLEALNAVAYFSPESREAPKRLGMKGFWMGYFACRAAPMGPVGAGLVEATFFNFHPDRVRRAIPDAWAIATPGDVLEARSVAAAAALRRLLPDGEADRLAAGTLPLLRTAIDGAVAAGRPLFAANRDVAPPADPVAELWQAATTLREHRGDAHVALLCGAGLDGCEVHVLFAATEHIAPELFMQSRGWSADDWRAAVERLAARNLVDRDGAATPAGHHQREAIERRTDELALPPYMVLGDEQLDELLRSLGGPVRQIAAAAEIPFPNPMGLPTLG